MPAPLILIAALVCNITHPLVVKAADAIPDNELQLLYVPMTAIDMCRMLKRRLKDAGLPLRLSPHSFRVATITDLLTQGVPLEEREGCRPYPAPALARRVGACTVTAPPTLDHHG